LKALYIGIPKRVGASWFIPMNDKGEGEKREEKREEKRGIEKPVC